MEYELLTYRIHQISIYFNSTAILFQAAILQQTAEYIYQLEQEKTQLLSQNCQLKRLVNQHEGGDVPIKKRKPDNQGECVRFDLKEIDNFIYNDYNVSLTK